MNDAVLERLAQEIVALRARVDALEAQEASQLIHVGSLFATGSVTKIGATAGWHTAWLSSTASLMEITATPRSTSDRFLILYGLRAAKGTVDSFWSAVRVEQNGSQAAIRHGDGALLDVTNHGLSGGVVIDDLPAVSTKFQLQVYQQSAGDLTLQSERWLNVFRFR